MLKMMMSQQLRAPGLKVLFLCLCALLLSSTEMGLATQQQGGSEGAAANSRPRKNETRGGVRSVTIPVTMTRHGGSEAREELQTLELVVQEDNEPQEILSARGADRAPLALAVLIQDNLGPPVSNEISGLASFIRGLRDNPRVLVGYLRSGSPQIRQRFTNDLERAAKALRIPVGSPTAAPYNPYVELVDMLKRFDSQPTGRRAVLLVSDGVDLSHGIENSAPTQSLDLQHAINEAQRRGVAVYSIYTPAAGNSGGNFTIDSNGQSCLKRLSDETGGRAFFQGLGAPVSFDPFLRDLSGLLTRQFALTYLSTHPSKEFHRIKLQTAQTDVELTYPNGYTRK